MICQKVYIIFNNSLVAYSYLCFGFKDILELGRIIILSEASELKKKYELIKLKKIIQYCDSNECRSKVLLQLMGEEVNICGKCDNCLNSFQQYDATTLVQKILSTIYKLKQKCTISHIIDILRGKASIDVQIWDHHKLSTFGLCSDLSSKELRRTIRKLYSKDIIDLDFVTGYIKLNNNSIPILKGLQDIYLPITQSKSAKFKQVSRHMFWLRTELEERVYREILNYRHNIALLHKVSQHAVLSDKVIYEIVTKKPMNLEQLQDIYGIGKIKLDKYGNDLIRIINKYFIQ